MVFRNHINHLLMQTQRLIHRRFNKRCAEGVQNPPSDFMISHRCLAVSMAKEVMAQAI